MRVPWIARKLNKSILKEINPEYLLEGIIHSEGDQPWDFFGSNGAKAETPMLWPSDVKSQLIGKDPDAGKD